MKTGYRLVDGDPEYGIPPATPRHWALCLAFVIIAEWIFQVAYGLNQVVVTLVSSLGGYGGWTIPFAAVAWLIFPFAIVALAAAWLSRRYDQRGFSALGVNTRAVAGAAPWVLAGVVASGLTLASFALLPPGWIEGAAEAMLWLIPATIIQAGAEEILFRGVLLSMLVARYGAARGVLISSLLFAIWHLYAGQAFIDAGVAVVMTFVLGLGFAVLALHQGHLGGAIALHAVWNLIADLETGLVDWTGVGGLLGASHDFWSSYIAHSFEEWTPEDLISQETLRNTVFPLVLQTMIVLAACRVTVGRIFGNSAQTASEAAAD